MRKGQTTEYKGKTYKVLQAKKTAVHLEALDGSFHFWAKRNLCGKAGEAKIQAEKAEKEAKKQMDKEQSDTRYNEISAACSRANGCCPVEYKGKKYWARPGWESAKFNGQVTAELHFTDNFSRKFEVPARLVKILPDDRKFERKGSRFMTGDESHDQEVGFEPIYEQVG